MILYKISNWHKITAEKNGAYYDTFDCVKSVFGGKWEKTQIRQNLTFEQIKQIKAIYKTI